MRRSICTLNIMYWLFEGGAGTPCPLCGATTEVLWSAEHWLYVCSRAPEVCTFGYRVHLDGRSEEVKRG